ncbi:MAG: protein kinase [Planctomycetota bacterium]
MSLSLPRKIGRYELIRLLGEGSDGSVYLARDTSRQSAVIVEHVAIKLIGSDEAAVREFERARVVTHSVFARCLDLVEYEGGVALVYEYIRGKSLSEWSGGTPTDIQRSVRITSVLAHAIAAAHRQQIYHRDLKPDNVMIDEGSDAVRIIDLGRAAKRTNPADLPGQSYNYAPPEVSDVDPVAIDVYSLGGILYFLLTGQPPNPLSQLDQHDAIRREALRNMPPELKMIVMRTLISDPVARYRSVDQLASDLDLFLSGQPIPWFKPPPSHRLKVFARKSSVPAACILIGSFATAPIAWMFGAERSQQYELAADQRVADVEAEKRIIMAEAESIRDEAASSLEESKFLVTRFRAMASRYSVEMMSGLRVTRLPPVIIALDRIMRHRQDPDADTDLDAFIEAEIAAWNTVVVNESIKRRNNDTGYIAHANIAASVLYFEIGRMPGALNTAKNAVETFESLGLTEDPFYAEMAAYLDLIEQVRSAGDDVMAIPLRDGDPQWVRFTHELGRDRLLRKKAIENPVNGTIGSDA